MPVYRLDDKKIMFPDPRLAEDDGLLAIGGDLSMDRLILAYSNGIFPWYTEGEPVLWWAPKERFIIRPANIHVSHSMRKFFRKHEISIRINRDFADTMHRCRIKREFTEEGTWITDDMEVAYKRLCDNGFALSVESFVDGELAGGLYGVSLGRCFFGESMFSEMENGSKIALILFSKVLEENDYVMIDCQFETEHLKSMGGEMISFEEYRELLTKGFERKEK
ncbi:leucyl/phenylalanyl-tRNA--protein transferase [Butyrivibrio sp. ob235]|uniref:leucyl/phenylalanyl-tRNA--protein transferase n=1 Tax=Butyrivibrio sp. ob235 TaxID=1761780 RepID=UPI0008CED42A|nr:leucyl/phenylalanyl-tRNA--protein transferase [Butyrivibrio sp. ob235]SEK25243.1 leucyl/phenylalanyl-tRNA--protein transferase [Butyrivibrio sp. ob235]